MNHSTPGLPVHHKLPEFTQTHAHRVGDAIQPSHKVTSNTEITVTVSIKTPLIRVEVWQQNSVKKKLSFKKKINEFS